MASTAPVCAVERVNFVFGVDYNVFWLQPLLNSNNIIVLQKIEIGHDLLTDSWFVNHFIKHTEISKQIFGGYQYYNLLDKQISNSVQTYLYITPRDRNKVNFSVCMS